MFVALQRWVAVAILLGAFVAGAFGGFVLRAATSKEGGTAVKGPEPAARSASVPLAAAAAAPQAQPPIVVKVIAEAAKAAPSAPAPFRPSPTPAKAAVAKAAAVTERPAALGTPEVKPDPTPGHFYKVQAGDTLHEVAMRAYGGVKKLGDLIHANPALDPNRIRIGAVVYVPAGTEGAPAGPGEAAAPAPAAAPPGKPAAPAAAPAVPATVPVSEEASAARK